MKTKRIEQAYQILKEYHNDTNKSITFLSKKHNVHNLGIVAKKHGLLKKLETRRPTTQDAINCLEWLIKYAQENTLKRNIETTTKKSLTSMPKIPRKIENRKNKNSNTSFKIKKAVKEYNSRVKKLNLFWGALKAEW